MKTFAAVLTSAVFAALAVAPVHAQQSEGSRDLHHPESPTSSAALTQGMKGAGMPMMGGIAPEDAKDRADMPGK